MSLFLRIFLFFWLTAALLATSFFLLGRVSGSEAIERKREMLEAQAVTVSTLWQQGGHRLLRQWMAQLPYRERPMVLQKDGHSPFPRHAARHRPPGQMLQFPLQSGVQRHGFGHVSLIVEVPDTDPALFLVARLEPSQLDRLPRWLWFVSAFLIISLISYLLALVLSRRLRQLRLAVQEFSQGDLHRRVDSRGGDEVAALARDFNQMADHINAMLSSQRQLVSDVSHELRSPLARLRIALELAQRKGDHSDALPRIEKEADELENLVTHLLSLARIESGQFQLERQFTDMTDLLNQIVRDANFEGEQKTCSIRLLSTGTVSLNIDRVLIRAAIENVIRNAIRHSPPDSEIVVSTLASDSEFRIIIDDNGPGVPEAALDKLFQPFARVGQSRDRVSGGFGLGLAITGRNLLAHGGQVYAQNRDVGGLRVVLGLPM
jgi:two-component system sensor histidine kinase CpxA